MHFMHFRPRFFILMKIGGFYGFAKIFGLGFVVLFSHDHALHFLAL